MAPSRGDGSHVRQAIALNRAAKAKPSKKAQPSEKAKPSEKANA
jgi:hypothetical protein